MILIGCCYAAGQRFGESRRVGGRLLSSPGSNATHSSRPPLGGRPRSNFTRRGFLGGKEAPELFKSSVPLLCEGLPGLTECLPLLGGGCSSPRRNRNPCSR